MKIECKDQLGRVISLIETPKRIISLNPSQTETIVDLGLSERLVGITKFCIHPKQLRKQKTIVGGTKKVSFKKIKELKPDIILCNKEENTQEIVETLAKEFPVHVTDIATIADVIEMMNQYGLLFNKKKEAQQMCGQISSYFDELNTLLLEHTYKRAVYFIWKNPWMVVGGNTFIDFMLDLNKFENIYKNEERYPMVTTEELKKQDIDYILLSSEPFPFKEQHLNELQKELPNAKIKFVDGEYFSWYGSRLLKAFGYFKELQLEL
ncbi:helical backbone metal receptor [uncultured Croceitalea sp.]|uniref:ABC transporter substrate-binding protein n=1 Tax=uncultured Croceitalea sp. TaxID=1798908 RepID=UPI0033062AAF